jgi:GntR family transcriptional regulator, rspAB operon transcriptional repressor
MDQVVMRSRTGSAGRGQGATSVYDALRADIVALRLQPGAPLSRLDLQSRFGLSSTPLRDALMRLQEDDLVEVFPQHATLISRIDLDHARQAQFLRRSVECETVRQLAETHGEPVRDRLATILRRQEALASIDDMEAFLASDLEFHRVMFEGLGLIDIWLIIRRQASHIDRLRRLHLPVPGKMQQILADHAAILTGIADGDGAAAVAAMRAHLAKSLDLGAELKATNPAWFRE